MVPIYLYNSIHYRDFENEEKLPVLCLYMWCNSLCLKSFSNCSSHLKETQRLYIPQKVYKFI